MRDRLGSARAISTMRVTRATLSSTGPRWARRKRSITGTLLGPPARGRSAASSSVPAAPKISASGRSAPASSATLAAEEREEAAGLQLHTEGPALAGELGHEAPRVDAVDAGAVRANHHVDARVRQGLLLERLVAAQVPAHRPVAVHQRRQVFRRRVALQVEARRASARIEDAVGLHVAFVQYAGGADVPQWRP